VNGTPVKTGNDLVNPIAQAPIGSKVKLSYVRDRAQKETTAIVEDRTRSSRRKPALSDQQGESAQPSLACASIASRRSAPRASAWRASAVCWSPMLSPRALPTTSVRARRRYHGN